MGTVNAELIKAAGLMPCILYECASDLVVVNTSPNTFELIGIRSENIVGKKTLWEDRLDAEDRDRLMARFSQLGWTDVASEAHKIIDDGGLPVWVAHSFRKVNTGHNTTIHGCIIPLSDTRRATGVEHTTISQFVHKIGNYYQLMNLLIGSLQRMGANANELESLQQTVDRAVEFIQAFSHYTQPLAGVTPIDLGDLLDSATKSIVPAFLEKNVAVIDSIEPSLRSAIIAGDGHLLEIAFTSVLQNAFEATKSGDQIVISGRSDMEGLTGRSSARIVIRDTGCGIEKGSLGRVTEPFVSTKRDRDGLGLSTAVRIVEMHGGALQISSIAGRGTQVEFLLPIGRLESKMTKTS